MPKVFAPMYNPSTGTLMLSGREIRGLTKSQAEDVLDWLENNGFDLSCDVSFSENGVTLRFH